MGGATRPEDRVGSFASLKMTAKQGQPQAVVLASGRSGGSQITTRRGGGVAGGEGSHESASAGRSSFASARGDGGRSTLCDPGREGGSAA
jgi:hypothetical protein